MSEITSCPPCPEQKECPVCPQQKECPQCEVCPKVVIPAGAESGILTQQFQAPKTVSWPANTYFPKGYEVTVSGASSGSGVPQYIRRQQNNPRPGGGIVVAQ